MVHQITQANHRGHQTRRDHQFVEGPQHAPMAYPLRVKVNGDDYTQRPPVAGQPAFPYFQDLDGIRQIITRIIEEAMPQTCADYRAKHRVYQKRVDPRLGQLLFLPHPVHDHISDRETDGECQSIPANLPRAYRKDRGIGRPGNEIQHTY